MGRNLAVLIAFETEQSINQVVEVIESKVIEVEISNCYRNNESFMHESSPNPRHEQVAKLAYELWERNGRPKDSAERDWQLAEHILEFLNPAKPPFGALSLEASEE
jgi:hypothetical protein